MKIIHIALLTSFFCTISNSIFSQNPENGTFWSLEIAKETLNMKTMTYDGMGYIETPTGQYAFKFEQNKVTMYSEGFLGKDYKKIETFPITRCTLNEKTSLISSYIYVNIAPNKDNPEYIFQIDVSNDNYKIAYVYILENYENGYAKKRTAFKVVRDYNYITNNSN